MEKDSKLEGIEMKDLEGICVSGKHLGEDKGYETSEEIYTSLKGFKVSGNCDWGRCDFRQCDYSKK